MDYCECRQLTIPHLKPVFVLNGGMYLRTLADPVLGRECVGARGERTCTLSQSYNKKLYIDCVYALPLPAAVDKMDYVGIR